jgi:transposase InsO family protein
MATATDPCSQHTRASRRGGQIQTASSQLIQANGLPNPRLPEPLSRNPADATPATGRVSSPYNEERLHEALGDMPPAEYERMNIKTDNTRILSAR